MAHPYQKLGSIEFCILLQLYDKVSLTVSHIRKLCFRNNAGTAAHKVIRKLKHLGFIHSASNDFGRCGRLEDIHTLAYRGWQCLIHFDLLDELTAPFSKKVAPSLIADCVHRMAIVEYWIALEIDIAKHDNFELSMFIPEFKRLENGKSIGLSYKDATGQEWRLRNDALFVLRDVLQEKEYLYLLEIDRGTVPIALKEKSYETVERFMYGRSCLESKLLRLQHVLSVFHQSIAGLGSRFSHFSGARVVIVTSGVGRVKNIIKKIPFHPELLKKEIFLLSYFDETNKGAFNCRYALPMWRDGKMVVGTKQIKHLICT